MVDTLSQEAKTDVKEAKSQGGGGHGREGVGRRPLPQVEDQGPQQPGAEEVDNHHLLQELLQFLETRKKKVQKQEDIPTPVEDIKLQLEELPRGLTTPADQPDGLQMHQDAAEADVVHDAQAEVADLVQEEEDAELLPAAAPIVSELDISDEKVEDIPKKKRAHREAWCQSPLKKTKNYAAYPGGCGPGAGAVPPPLLLCHKQLGFVPSLSLLAM